MHNSVATWLIKAVLAISIIGVAYALGVEARRQPGTQPLIAGEPGQVLITAKDTGVHGVAFNWITPPDDGCIGLYDSKGDLKGNLCEAGYISWTYKPTENITGVLAVGASCPQDCGASVALTGGDVLVRTYNLPNRDFIQPVAVPVPLTGYKRKYFQSAKEGK